MTEFGTEQCKMGEEKKAKNEWVHFRELRARCPVCKKVDQIVTTYKVAGKPVNTWVSGIMSGIKRNEFSEYRIPDRKQSYL